MPLEKRGKYWYGDTQADIPAEIARYSGNNYPAEHFAGCVCRCGSRTFRLALDDTEGAAVHRCASCEFEHPIGDSEEYLPGANLGECECPCGSGLFEIAAGVALYEGSEDVRWLYVGCRCVACGLVACYGDWKNEHEDYRAFLAGV